MQAHSAAALVSRPSVAYALQDRSPLALPARLRVRPAPQASTARFRVWPPPVVIARPVLSPLDLLRRLPAHHVLLGSTVPYLASKHANSAQRELNARHQDAR